MKKNYMREVAEMLGVEFGEVFTIEGLLCHYHIDEKGLCAEGSVYSNPSQLYRLLKGDFSIIKQKDPYKEWCTVEDIERLGIELELDQPVLVRDDVSLLPATRHFARIVYGEILCWNNGRTSHTTTVKWSWKYIKLIK